MSDLVSVGEAHPYLDANRVAKRLWMGAFPRPPRDLGRLGFSMLVLCAEEVQPPAAEYQGVRVVYAPNNDDGSPFTAEQERVAREAARQVVAHWREGGRILVTCWLGHNRSGLVTALALLELSDLTAAQVVAVVRRARGPRALSNRQFESTILASPPRARPLPHGPAVQVLPR